MRGGISGDPAFPAPVFPGVVFRLPFSLLEVALPESRYLRVAVVVWGRYNVLSNVATWRSERNYFLFCFIRMRVLEGGVVSRGR